MTEMVPLPMTDFGPLVAAVLGSTGIASLLSGISQLKRAKRLQGLLKELDLAVTTVPTDSRECIALKAAKEQVALDLASDVLIKRDARILILVGFALGVASGLFIVYMGMGVIQSDFLEAMTGKGGNSTLFLAGVIVIAVFYIAVLMFLYSRQLQQRRQRFVEGVRGLEGTALTIADTLRIAQES